jgi:hypothetical protein
MENKVGKSLQQEAKVVKVSFITFTQMFGDHPVQYPMEDHHILLHL